LAQILIVDDDIHTRELYVSLLTPFGHQVIEAADGKEGLEVARLRKPALIISDILMPTMNGYEFVSSIRNFPGLENIPVIFHSASFLDHETRSLGASCGVSFFITKPCEPEKALAVVHQALNIQGVAPEPHQSTLKKSEAIPVLIDAYFQKGKQLDAVSVRLASLLEFGLDLSRPCGVPDLLRKVGNAAREIVGANYAAVGILKEDSFDLESFTVVGMDVAIVEKIGTPVFSGPIFQSMISERAPQRAFNQHGEPGILSLPAYHPLVHSFLIVPLLVGDRLYGWIYVAQKLSAIEFSDEDERILMALAAQTGLAYENSLSLLGFQRRTLELEVEVEDRKRAESRLRMLIEAAPMGIVISNKRGRIAEANAQALRMFGYEREELLEQSVETLLPDRLRQSHGEHRASYARDPHARPMGLGMELFARRKDGTEFPVEISLGPLETKDEMLISSIIVDITARKKMENQLRLSQRMEAIGNLAGGVAHDFNNLLAVIIGCSDVVLDALPPDHPATKKIEMVKQAGSSAADLTRQLLAFSRQQMLKPQVLDLKAVVDKTQVLLRRLIGENIEITTSLEPSLGHVMADPGQIEQVVMNLAVNARDAMPKGGRLTIEAHNVELDEPHRHDLQVVPGSYVLLSVADTGCGMDRETQSRIFDPYFTTKELGKGTGLGLATVYGIVKQSGGYIWVYSESGKGSVFKVYLPIVQKTILPTAQKEPESTNLRGKETILFAEDSNSLREMTKEYLESMGYTVLDASSGREALQRAHDFDGPIDLLLTDVVMPEMSGPELATEIGSLRPRVRIIFTSGYTDDAIARQGILDPRVAFIQKPYRPKALARKIREVLDERRANSDPYTPPGLQTLTNA
jgi:two-component system cell cycle sensor histidine kinase/response regulator CckA